MRGRVVVTIGLALFASAFSAARVGAEPTRRVLGTLRAAGSVETSLDGTTWRPTTGGAVVEGMTVRTGAGSHAILALENGDMIGLDEGTTCELVASNPARVRVVAGQAAFRIGEGSATLVEARGAVVRAPLARPASVGPRREGLVRVDAKGVTVHGYGGTSEVVSADGTASVVPTGQVATIGETGAVRVADAGKGPGRPTHARRKGGGPFDWFPSIFGLSPGASAAVLGGAVAAAGGGIAAGVAGGGGGGGGSDDAAASPGQGSPFRTPR